MSRLHRAEENEVYGVTDRGGWSLHGYRQGWMESTWLQTGLNGVYRATDGVDGVYMATDRGGWSL